MQLVTAKSRTARLLPSRSSRRMGALTLQPGWVSRDILSPLSPAIVNGVVFALASGESRSGDRSLGNGQSVHPMQSCMPWMAPRVRNSGIAATPSRPLFTAVGWPLEEGVCMWEATTGHSTRSASRWNIRQEEIDEDRQSTLQITAETQRRRETMRRTCRILPVLSSRKA